MENDIAQASEPGVTANGTEQASPTPETAATVGSTTVQDEPDGQAPADEQTDCRTRILELLNDMGAQKSQMLAIIDFCREERTSAEIDEMLVPYQEYRKSVYTPINMRSLLENAGALSYQSHDEAPEEMTDEDGNLIVPEDCGEGTWLATDTALQIYEEQDPFADLVHTIDDDGAYLDVYLHILNFVAEKDRSISEIEHSVAESGLIDGDKRQAGYFVGKLEDIGGLEWRGIWTLGDLGRQYLSLQ